MNIKQIEDALKNEEASPPDLAQFGTILADYCSYNGQMLNQVLSDKPLAYFNIQALPIMKLKGLSAEKNHYQIRKLK
jgi:hypothetical protein